MRMDALFADYSAQDFDILQVFSDNLRSFIIFMVIMQCANLLQIIE